MLTDPGAVPRHANPLPASGLREDDEEEQDDDVETSRLTAGIGTLHRNKEGDFVADGEGHAAATQARAGGRAAIVGRGLGSRAEAGRDSEDSSVAAAMERGSQVQPPIKWCHK